MYVQCICVCMWIVYRYSACMDTIYMYNNIMHVYERMCAVCDAIYVCVCVMLYTCVSV